VRHCRGWRLCPLGASRGGRGRTPPEIVETLKNANYRILKKRYLEAKIGDAIGHDSDRNELSTVECLLLAWKRTASHADQCLFLGMEQK
jgi:hypothetical protein